MMVMMEASPSRVRMEVGGAATWNLPHVFRTVLHMSCEVRSAYSFEVRRARCPWTPPPPPACPRSPPACPPPSTLRPGLPLHARDHWPQGPLVLVGEPAFSGRWGFSWVGCCSLFVWEMGGRSRACSRPTRREAGARRVRGRDEECLWTLFAQPTIIASIAGCAAPACRLVGSIDN